MAAPTTVNAVASDVNAVLDGTINTAGVPLVQAAITTAVPFLGLPVVSTIVGWIIGYFAKQFYRVLAQLATDGVITIQVGIEKTELNQAVAAVSAAQASGDANALSQATEKARQAFANLVHYDGSASP